MVYDIGLGNFSRVLQHTNSYSKLETRIVSYSNLMLFILL